MIDIKPGTPAHEGYNAAISYIELTSERTEPTCPYAHDTQEFSDWQEGYSLALGDLSILSGLDEEP